MSKTFIKVLSVYGFIMGVDCFLCSFCLSDVLQDWEWEHM